MPMSLEHLKVLDLTIHLSGPYCAMILADHGADVVKVERPEGGDDMRRTPPFTGGESAPFMLWNRNKRSVALDLKSTADLATFKAMATVADVVVESFKPGTAQRLGIGYEALSALNPRLVYCSISGFGQTGPYASRGGFDLIAAGMSGLMSINGPPPKDLRSASPSRSPTSGRGSTAPSASSPLSPPASGQDSVSTSTPRCSSPGSRWASTRRPGSSRTAKFPNGSGRGIAAAPRTSSSPPPTVT